MTVSMLDLHAEALEGSAAYHEFLLFYKRAGNVVYGFVEGLQDPSFYRSVIDSILPDGWRVRLFQAGNRDKVVKTCLEIDWGRFDRRRVCFFVDRDLTAFVGGGENLPQNIYVTDQYSIENDVVNHETLSRLLEEVFNIVGLTPDEEHAINRMFDEEYGRFCEAMIAPMSQILIWRKNGNRPCLDNVKLKEWFEFSNGRISIRTGYIEARSRVEYVARRCKCDPSSSELLASAEGEFRGKGGVPRYIRGKYVLWFFVRFALSIYESVQLHCARYMKKPKAHISLGIENAMVILGTRVRAPESLRVFLTKSYMSYIEEAPGSQSQMSLTT